MIYTDRQQKARREPKVYTQVSFTLSGPEGEDSCSILLPGEVTENLARESVIQRFRNKATIQFVRLVQPERHEEEGYTRYVPVRNQGGNS